MKFNKGFSKHSNYCNVNFDLLDSYITEESARDKYYNNIYNLFHTLFKNSKDIDFILWDVRIQKSLKEIYTSASFYCESDIALKDKNMSSYFFLSYYSLFHAFLSVLYLDSTMSLNQLFEMAHNKVKMNFINLYCKGKRKIISPDIGKEFELLRFYREYYSYSMPFNEFFSDLKDLNRPDQFLKNRLMHCFQIACLLSNVIENSSHKFNNGLGRLSAENLPEFEMWFNKINGKPHPFKPNLYLLDPSDKFMKSDFYTSMAGQPNCFSIHLEHFMDEFGMYVSDYINSKVVSEANRLVFKSIS